MAVKAASNEVTLIDDVEAPADAAADGAVVAELLQPPATIAVTATAAMSVVRALICEGPPLPWSRADRPTHTARRAATGPVSPRRPACCPPDSPPQEPRGSVWTCQNAYSVPPAYKVVPAIRRPTSPGGSGPHVAGDGVAAFRVAAGPRRPILPSSGAGKPALLRGRHGDGEPDVTSNPDLLALADWRRRIAELYAEVRRRTATDPAGAHATWRAEREALYRGHPASPVPIGERGAFS